MIEARAFRRILVSGVAFAAMASAMPAWAQTTGTQDTTQEAATPTGAVPTTSSDETDSKAKGSEIIVTGSRIKQDPNNSALPLQIITQQEITRNGISSPEQLMMFLTANGSGADNLASNADVTTGAQ